MKMDLKQTLRNSAGDVTIIWAAFIDTKPEFPYWNVWLKPMISWYTHQCEFAVSSVSWLFPVTGVISFCMPCRIPTIKVNNS